MPCYVVNAEDTGPLRWMAVTSTSQEWPVNTKTSIHGAMLTGKRRHRGATKIGTQADGRRSPGVMRPGLKPPMANPRRRDPKRTRRTRTTRNIKRHPCQLLHGVDTGVAKVPQPALQLPQQKPRWRTNQSRNSVKSSLPSRSTSQVWHRSSNRLSKSRLRLSPRM